jgi:hypothetical protein
MCCLRYTLYQYIHIYIHVTFNNPIVNKHGNNSRSFVTPSAFLQLLAIFGSNSTSLSRGHCVLVATSSPQIFPKIWDICSLTITKKVSHGCKKMPLSCLYENLYPDRELFSRFFLFYFTLSQIFIILPGGPIWRHRRSTVG